MIVRKTQRDFKKKFGNAHGDATYAHWTTIHRSTYWFLFIPVYTKDELFSSAL